MSVSSCSSLNSAVTWNMEIVIKMSFIIKKTLLMIMIIVIAYF